VDRPFEVGCMVVCNKYGIGVVTELNATFYKYVECKFESKRIDFSLRGYETFEDERCTVEEHKTEMLNSVITAIRKPRKGGKEARDIVAMLGRIAHRDLLVWYRIAKAGGQLAIYWGKRKSEKVNSFLVFDAAKSMLGVSNE